MNFSTKGTTSFLLSKNLQSLKAEIKKWAKDFELNSDMNSSFLWVEIDCLDRQEGSSGYPSLTKRKEICLS